MAKGKVAAERKPEILNDLLAKAQKSLSARLSIKKPEPKSLEIKLAYRTPVLLAPEIGQSSGAAQSSMKLGISKTIQTKEWLKMNPTPLSAQLAKDLHIIQNRHVLDPKRHYKKMDKIGKVFQMGTVVATKEEHRNRLTRKEKGNTIVEELLENNEIKTYLKRKEVEISAKRNFITRKGFKKRK
jgi:hypothetical protein